MSMAGLGPQDALLLVKFVCHFAWADGQVKESERRFINKLLIKLGLAGNDQAARWLANPPPAYEMDPKKIPANHRQIFLETVRDIITIDGDLADRELESLKRFDMMLRGG